MSYLARFLENGGFLREPTDKTDRTPRMNGVLSVLSVPSGTDTEKTASGELARTPALLTQTTLPAHSFTATESPQSVTPGSGVPPWSMAERLAIAARGDELRARGAAAPLLWIPPDQPRWVQTPMPGRRDDGTLWYE
jgi:hypothetical protein